MGAGQTPKADEVHPEGELEGSAAKMEAFHELA